MLIDAGAEFRGYAADITRTFPVNGRFTAPQRALHDLVGAAQAAALAQARPGIPYEAGHLAAVETLTEGLLQLGLLKGKLEKNISSGEYKRFYRHKTGHWLGLDAVSYTHLDVYKRQGETSPNSLLCQRSSCLLYTSRCV